MELTLVGPSIEPVSTESGKDFPDVGQVLLRIIGVYQDIIQVYDYGDVNHVGEDVVHDWKPTGALVSPSGITSHSKDLYRVQKVVFHSSPSAMRMRW